MTGWLIALGILVLIAIIPIGASLIYHEEGFFLSVICGLIKIKILPQNPKKKNKPKKEKPKKEKPPKEEKKDKGKETPKGDESKEKKGGKITDFLPLVDIAIRLLGSFRRKLRVNRLEVNYVMAGGDPCDLAVNYGKAWTAVGNLMPLLERAFVIKKRNIQVQCDFASDETRIHARLDITITIGRLVGMLVKYGVLALIEFLKIQYKRKNNKGGAEL